MLSLFVVVVGCVVWVVRLRVCLCVCFLVRLLVRVFSFYVCYYYRRCLVLLFFVVVVVVVAVACCCYCCCCYSLVFELLSLGVVGCLVVGVFGVRCWLPLLLLVSFGVIVVGCFISFVMCCLFVFA